MTGALDGRRILVVGAGSRHSDDPDAPPGNGRAIAVAAAREGATVACADVDRDAAHRTAAMAAADGGTAVVLVADVTDADECAGVVQDAAEAMGGLDGLVCNVGIGKGVLITGTTPDEWDAVFALNVRSHFLLTAAALPLMEAGSAIVYISSVAALTAGTRSPAYDSSKAAITGLCRQAAMEGARKGVRVNAVAPGLIDTPMGRAASGGRPSRERTPVPLGRQGTAWEVAAPVVFLLSDAASYITAQVLAVDGGLTS